ncbi:uncharacterized protein LOC122247097 [Penaeus japonicus]|uniref:uncharacterized protein LOC122247097 n=1 Tax=Penaeus japonicus TaxID=27405 RepID=UPI001C71042B|nr:uncharacterized protein LOC122247097 [Penaeus japonicus]
MKVLVVVLVAVVAVAASAPQYVYNYAFNIPNTEVSDPRPVNSGFQAPATYVSPLGAPFVWSYNSPQVGYVNTAQVVPQTAFIAPVATKAEDGAPSVALKSAPFVVQVPGSQPTFNALSPLLRQAADTGKITFDRESSPGILQYSVSQDFSEGADSISSLAAQLNAIPVAAVHDAQSPPRFRQSVDATDPVLSFRDEAGVTKFRLEIPTQ